MRSLLIPILACVVVVLFALNISRVFIAGHGTESSGRYVGFAPAANLVSVKVAGATGVSNTSTVLAGIDWAIKKRDTYGIRVMNLSMGVVPVESTTTATCT